MNSVEQAIRAAISKGDEQDQGFRRKIYGSASAALERSLSARPFTDPEKSNRRQSFLATVKLIESEFVLAEELEENQGAQQNAPVLEARNVAAGPDLATASNKGGVYPTFDQRPRQRTIKKSKFSTLLPSWLGAKMATNIAILVAVAIGSLWTYQEAKRLYAEASSSSPASVKPVLAENGTANDKDPINWIQVFSANDTDLLTSSGSAKAEIRSVDGNRSVAMSGDSANEIGIKIGAGLLQTFAGKRVLFNFKARNADSKTLETGVRCQFGAETKCERKRFKVDAETSEFMFAVTVSPNPENEGALLIAPDLTGSGGIVEIETIRATFVEPTGG